MPTVDVNGTSLECVETGTGEPVVLVHGGISDHCIWEAQREALGHHSRAIAYSRNYRAFLAAFTSFETSKGFCRSGESRVFPSRERSSRSSKSSPVSRW